MTSTPPFIAQERPDSCAIACLRMLLAKRGTRVTEQELIQAADMQIGGLTPDELVALANRYGFQARETTLDWQQIARLIESKVYPITFLYRGPLDNVPNVHAVLPLHYTRQFVTVLDPLRGRRRVSIRKFEVARSFVGGWVVVCETR